jgi:hypothetical protein
MNLALISQDGDRCYADGQKAMSTQLSKLARKELHLEIKYKGWEQE